MSLDQCIEFIAEDELVEVTPESIRLRKPDLDPQVRMADYRSEKYACNLNFIDMKSITGKDVSYMAKAMIPILILVSGG